MTNPYENVDHAARAIYHAEAIQLPGIAATEYQLAAAGIRAVTYALLDLAAAVRERGA